MRDFYIIILFVALGCLIWTTQLYGQDQISDQKAKAIFKALDKDGDGRISQEEWERADKNKNNKINKKEWERFHFKSDGKVDGWRVIGWYDLNNDGYMDSEEFMYNFRNRRK